MPLFRISEKHFAKDPELTRALSSLEKDLRQQFSGTLLDGLLIKNVDLSNGNEVTIAHKLGRPCVGYIITKKDSISGVSGVVSDDGLFITFVPDAGMTIDVWVF